MYEGVYVGGDFGGVVGVGFDCVGGGGVLVVVCGLVCVGCVVGCVVIGLLVGVGFFVCVVLFVVFGG